MTSASENSINPQAISVSNFDLSSLYLLRPEITVTLNNAENHLSEFYDNDEQAPLLLDSVAMLEQLSNVLKLISLDEGNKLAEVLSQAMQHLYDLGDNTNDGLIIAASQGVMTLNRYIEFVLLQETLEPSLLLPVINQLNDAIGREHLNAENLRPNDYANISLANPAKNFKSLDSVGLDNDFLATAYRSGLQVILSNKNGKLSDTELNNLQTMYQSCKIAAEKTDTLFWKAAEAATYKIQELLPLNGQQKLIFIFLDQQFRNYLPADDKRFADLVSFACLREHELALKLREELNNNQLEESQIAELRQFLFGPDQKITTILNDIIQAEINSVKNQVSNLVYSDNITTGTTVSKTDVIPISNKLNQLASTMHILGLEEAELNLKESEKIITNWTSPEPADLDALLNDLMIAENASINLSKAHTPGAQMNPFNNKKISIYQLDTAYNDLVDESRKNLSQVEQLISGYVDDINNPDKDVEILKDVPLLLKQVAGALRFMELTDAANVINRLSNYLDETFYIDDNIVEGDSNAAYRKYARVADVILSIDHTLSSLQQSHPVGKHAISLGNSSLNKLVSSYTA